jgi:hypothetical protein
VKHTKGPWKAMRSESYGACNSIYGPDKKSVANLGNARTRSIKEMEANAHLIAAAPELLEIVQAVLDCLDLESHEHIRNAAKAAIAKAEGRGK